jgi:hypothetical protein
MPEHDTSWGYQPGQEIGYVQITASVNIVSTTEATGTTIITCAAHIFDGGPVLVEFFSGGITAPSPANSFLSVSLFEGGTQITELLSLRAAPLTGSSFVPCIGKYRFTPTAGSHTYTITAYTSSTTGTPAVSSGAGGTATPNPTYVRFTKV